MLIVVSSCNKEIEYPNPQIACDYDNSTHIKHENYQKVLDKYIKKGLPGISALISTPEEGIWAGSAGYANIENKVKMTTCHLQFYGSIPKTKGK